MAENSRPPPGDVPAHEQKEDQIQDSKERQTHGEQDGQHSQAQEQDPSRTFSVRRYYETLESRIGYRALLGGTRHFGLYQSASSSALPVAPALRAMEARLLKSLQCPPGSRVLDAGCGDGHVAMYMASEGGLHVEAIDITPHHLAKARHNVAKRSLSHAITLQQLDYHDLSPFPDASFDGVYTIETFVHASDPARVLGEFYRVLRPGGRVVLHEYEHPPEHEMPAQAVKGMRIVNHVSSMPAFASFTTGTLSSLLHQAGFQNAVQDDLTENIAPLARLFYRLAIVPYQFIRLLGLQNHFINAVAAVQWWRARDYFHYIAISAQKPHVKSA